MFTVLLILVIATLLTSAGIALAALPNDGYGTRPGPRSHIDPFDPRNHVI
jgi:hypothetical protein